MGNATIVKELLEASAEVDTAREVRLLPGFVCVSRCMCIIWMLLVSYLTYSSTRHRPKIAVIKWL